MHRETVTINMFGHLANVQPKQTILTRYEEHFNSVQITTIMMYIMKSLLCRITLWIPARAAEAGRWAIDEGGRAPRRFVRPSDARGRWSALHVLSTPALSHQPTKQHVYLLPIDNTPATADFTLSVSHTHYSNLSSQSLHFLSQLYLSKVLSKLFAQTYFLLQSSRMRRTTFICALNSIKRTLRPINYEYNTHPSLVVIFMSLYSIPHLRRLRNARETKILYLSLWVVVSTATLL